MYLSAIFVPFISFVIISLTGRFIGVIGSTFVGIASMFFCTTLSLLIIFEVVYLKSICIIKLAPWFNIDTIVAGWGFLFDPLTAFMIFVVTGISCLVHIYACEYMENDPHKSRFISYLSLFTFFMLILVSADNYLQMFIGWEGVGLASFLLISFWNTRIKANKAAIKAMVMNRIGDMGLCFAFFALIAAYNSLDYYIIFSGVKLHTISILDFDVSLSAFVCFFILWGAVGKSAQLGLHTWLPDAMEGPTPVSALIHAATMVTAGVFVIIRSSPLFETAPTVLKVTCLIGAMTAFFAGTIGLVQNDLKKVIAFSTCSQLGYMIFSCGLSNYSVAFYHLANHAFFKALLFLGAGCIIHGIADEQDMRRMSFGKTFYFSYSIMVIGSLALIGFPFLTGYFSKDLILELAYARYDWVSNVAHILGIAAAFCTSLYSFRLLFLTFLNKNNSYKSIFENTHEPGILMSIPVFILCFGAIFVGFLTQDIVVGLGNTSWEWVYTTSLRQHDNLYFIEAEYLQSWEKHIPLFGGILGGFLALLFTSTMPSLKFRKIIFNSILQSTLAKNLSRFLIEKWHIDQIYNVSITNSLFKFSYKNTFFLIDKGFLETLGPKGISLFLKNNALVFSKINQGLIYNYAIIYITGILSFFFLLNFFSLTTNFGSNIIIGLSFALLYNITVE